MEDEDKIVYQLTVEDLQNVAIEEYGRELSPNEIEMVAEKIGDYFPDWYEKIDFAIGDILKINKI
jgi:hypothetical protein